MPRVGTPNLNLGTWLQGENPGDGSQTVDNTGLNGNMLKIDRALGTQHNVDGTHKANVITGANLVQTGAGAVADGTTVEFSSNAMRIKDGGVTGAKLAAAVVDNTTLQLAAGVMSVKTIADANISGLNGSKLVAGSVPVTALAYKELVMLIGQTGTYDPTFTVLSNTIGGAPIASRTATGIYEIDLGGSAPFTVGKTVGFISACLVVGGTLGYASIYPKGDGNGMIIATISGTALADGVLGTQSSVIIRVYP